MDSYERVALLLEALKEIAAEPSVSEWEDGSRGGSTGRGIRSNGRGMAPKFVRPTKALALEFYDLQVKRARKALAAYVEGE